MSPTLTHALVYLLGAITLAIPATVRGLPKLYASLSKWTQAKADLATAQLVQANANGTAMKSLSDGVDQCEERCNTLRDELVKRDAKIEAQQSEITKLHARCDALHEEMLRLRDALGR